MPHVTITVAANWFDGRPYGLSQSQKAARQSMTRTLTHWWLPINVDRAVTDVLGGERVREDVDVFLQEYSPYDYNTLDFRVDIGLEDVPTGADGLIYLAAVEDHLREPFVLFLLAAPEQFGDINMSRQSVTFRITCFRHEVVAAETYTVDMITGCAKPYSRQVTARVND